MNIVKAEHLGMCFGVRDAIALALRTGARMFISEKVAGYTMSVDELIDEKQQEEFRKLLEFDGPDDYKKSLH